MKILVSGGLGFIGSCLVERLFDTDHEVKIIDKQTYPANISFLKKLSEHNIFPRVTDISDTRELYTDIGNSDIVIHLAGIRFSDCEKNPAECYFTNEFMTKTIAEMCKMLDKRMIFSSTSSNYGISKIPATEIKTLNPISHYAKSKVNAEEHLMNIPNCTILRLATAFGVGSNFTRDDVIINDFVKSAVFKKKIELYQPHSYRPNLHVKDIAQAIQLVIENPNRVQNKVYNVGIDEMNKKKIEIIQQLDKFCKYKLVIQNDGDPRNYLVDFRRFNRFFDFRPEYSLESGIKELVEHYEKKVAIEYAAT